MKVLWAVDALDPFPEGMKKIADVLRKIGETVKLEVHPVFMLSPEQLGLSMEPAPPTMQTYLETSAQKALDQCMRDTQFPGMGKPEVVIHHRHSLKGAVRKFAEYAVAQNYDFVITGSHGRRGLQRLIVGSFTEELLLQSKKPVLVVGPHMEISAGTENRILIPNDLSNLDSPFFKESLRLAKQMGAKATLLHAIPKPVEAFLESGIYLVSGGWVPISAYLGEEKTKQEVKADQVLAAARTDGIDCESVVDHNCASVTDSILRHAKEKKASMIVMAAQSGPVTSALLGSITRKVIRDATCPVWVVRE